MTRVPGCVHAVGWSYSVLRPAPYSQDLPIFVNLPVFVNVLYVRERAAFSCEFIPRGVHR